MNRDDSKTMTNGNSNRFARWIDRQGVWTITGLMLGVSFATLVIAYVIKAII